MALSILRILETLRRADLEAGIIVDDDGITAWVFEPVGDRMEAVTWAGAPQSSALPSDRKIAEWLLEAATLCGIPRPDDASAGHRAGHA